MECGILWPEEQVQVDLREQQEVMVRQALLVVKAFKVQLELPVILERLDLEHQAQVGQQVPQGELDQTEEQVQRERQVVEDQRAHKA